MAGDPPGGYRLRQVNRLAAPQRLAPRRRHRGRLQPAPRRPRRARHLRHPFDAQLRQLRLLHRTRAVPPAGQPRGAIRLRRGAACAAPRPGPGHPLARPVHLPERGRVHAHGAGQDGRPVPPRRGHDAGAEHPPKALFIGLCAAGGPPRSLLPNPGRPRQPAVRRVHAVQVVLRGPDRGQILLPHHPRGARAARRHAPAQHPEAADDERRCEEARRRLHAARWFV
mmetsp:Transcript_6444/g.20669  ORF Transcript_6444/g.20669 Transcript_6444/m.20669 type:complete len:225 (+) Transcript_6444:147-821(+)